MGIKRVSKFQTSDNRLWNTEFEAKEHENLITAMTELTELLVSIKTGKVEAILREMVLEQAAVRDILLRYNKRTPHKPSEMTLAKVA